MDKVNVKQTLAWLPLAGCRLQNERQRALDSLDNLGSPLLQFR